MRTFNSYNAHLILSIFLQKTVAKSSFWILTVHQVKISRTIGGRAKFIHTDKAKMTFG